MENGRIIALIATMVIGFLGNIVMCASIQKKTGNDLSGGFFRKVFIVIAGFGLLGISTAPADEVTRNMFCCLLHLL